jgi:hypothetical protein
MDPSLAKHLRRWITGKTIIRGRHGMAKIGKKSSIDQLSLMSTLYCSIQINIGGEHDDQ